jgi:pimeloyl-ACP methyl ester carboxylesterase
MQDDSIAAAQRITFFTDDGLTLVADTWGHPGDRPVLLQHGGGQTRHAWGGTARALAERGWYAICLDLRGHGDSDWAADRNYGIDAYAADTIAVVRSLTHTPVVVGASLGGLAALLAQGEAEEDLFAALVLVDVTPRLNPSGTEAILGFMSAHMDDGFASLEEAADAIAAYLPHRKRPKHSGGLAKNLRLHDDGRYRWHWDPAFVTSKQRVVGRDPGRMLAASRKLRIPTLLVRGRMSELVTPEAAAEFLDLVPHAEFVDVSEAGHMVAGDRNDVFTAAVADFLSALGK